MVCKIVLFLVSTNSKKSLKDIKNGFNITLCKYFRKIQEIEIPQWLFELQEHFFLT